MVGRIDGRDFIFNGTRLFLSAVPLDNAQIGAASATYAAGVCWFCARFPPGESSWAGELAALNAVVLGVLIGFRTKAAYDRWWEGRIVWGKLVNDTRNLCLKAVALADPPADDRRELYRLAHRHTGGAATLLEWDAKIPPFPVVHAEVLKAKQYMGAELKAPARKVQLRAPDAAAVPHPLSYIVPEVA